MATKSIFSSLLLSIADIRALSKVDIFFSFADGCDIPASSSGAVLFSAVLLESSGVELASNALASVCSDAWLPSKVSFAGVSSSATAAVVGSLAPESSASDFSEVVSLSVSSAAESSLSFALASVLSFSLLGGDKS